MKVKLQLMEYKILSVHQKFNQGSHNIPNLSVYPYGHIETHVIKANANDSLSLSLSTI